ncbi:type IX secretion system membrane protein PorP/SprF [Vibrio breoganii]|uniref:conjugal transfer protein TraF n=1 Tax=Vibrio breoganii TaxID=553239 RepID=UPI0010BDBBBE|nr:conjugal transfer protein TraF [Vibrio breoganii]TKF90726.1 type IX secretion system membrane protein PorP/SprF [Vibrio breoganii]
MTNLNSKFLLGLGATLLVSNMAHASNFYADGRTTGMGGTGVASGNYLSAPFINPALLANSKVTDNFGLLLPSIGVQVSDKDESLSDIMDLQDDFDGLSENSSQESIDAFAKTLNGLEGDRPVVTEVSTGIAIALPFEAISVALFNQNYVNLVSMTDVQSVDSNDWSSVEQAYQNSTGSIVGVGVMDIGLTLAKKFSFDEHKLSVGVSPKFQQLNSFYSMSSLDDFELSDYDEASQSENTFNIDLGFLYQWHDLAVGLSAKNLIAQEIETIEVAGGSHIYNLDPDVTVGIAYQLEYFTMAFDADLTKQTRFDSIESDDTQYLRVGMEGNLFHWAQLRLGYEHDLEGNLQDAVTAGIGFSPFDVVHLDIAASYADETQAAIGLNLSLTL